eukprot:3878951-Rhodomonas_salina.2
MAEQHTLLAQHSTSHTAIPGSEYQHPRAHPAHAGSVGSRTRRRPVGCARVISVPLSPFAPYAVSKQHIALKFAQRRSDAGGGPRDSRV